VQYAIYWYVIYYIWLVHFNQSLHSLLFKAILSTILFKKKVEYNMCD